MKILKILSVSLFVFLFSCDKIDIPVKKQGDTCGIDSIPIRKILVADYTGHKCNNCPEAAETLHEIKTNYCDHIIPIAIHVSGFAAPSGSIFINDYRTEAGDELNDFFEVSNQGLPNGLVNRKEYNNSLVVSKDNWETVVNLLYNIPPDVYISIESSYNEETRDISVTIASEFLFNIDYSMNIGLYVTEDNIVSPQIFPDTIIQDYVHRHMLRKAVNGAFGENFVPSASFGDIIEKTFTFKADDEWNMEHIELVAFISNRETNEIIQAESEHVGH